MSKLPNHCLDIKAPTQEDAFQVAAWLTGRLNASRVRACDIDRRLKRGMTPEAAIADFLGYKSWEALMKTALFEIAASVQSRN